MQKTNIKLNIEHYKNIIEDYEQTLLTKKEAIMLKKKLREIEEEKESYRERYMEAKNRIQELNGRTTNKEMQEKLETLWYIANYFAPPDLVEFYYNKGKLEEEDLDKIEDHAT